MDYIWEASIVETCLQMMINLWEIRNGEIHGKEEAVKQQKRKAKAAISVRALHELQDQSQPSDAFLFYQDVEEKIENATAAKLEGFIAMKTKPITNSANKWAEQAACKVKAMVEWMKTRGKNNKEAIERLDRQNRDHFRHKAYKKPRKKNKGKDSTVHSTLRQTSLSFEWFCIP